jgi:hypothetical protein
MPRFGAIPMKWPTRLLPKPEKPSQPLGAFAKKSGGCCPGRRCGEKRPETPPKVIPGKMAHEPKKDKGDTRTEEMKEREEYLQKRERETHGTFPFSF